MRRAGNTLRVPEISLLNNDRVGTPANLRWLSITVDGVVTVHTVPNRMGYSVKLSRWIQWKLIHDVSGVIDPGFKCTELLGAYEVVETPDDGVVVWSHRPGSEELTAWAGNPVVTEMLSTIRIHRLVRGTVAWLGDTDPDSGMHADLSKYRVGCLQILAARAHSNVMAAM